MTKSSCLHLSVCVFSRRFMLALETENMHLCSGFLHSEDLVNLCINAMRNRMTEEGILLT